MFQPDQRPSPATYAFLSNYTYRGPQVIQPGESLQEGWEVEQIFSGRSAYFAVLYVHHETRQAVLAYRGTNTLKALIEDLKGIALNQWSDQKKEASRSIKAVIERLNDGEELIFEYDLSFTGHSLGAFLAELSVFYCHREHFPHVHAVTFESPGVRETLDSLQSGHEPLDYKALDITSYLSYPNLVNTCNHHVGSLYHYQPLLQDKSWLPFWTDLKHLMDIHTIEHPFQLFANPDTLMAYQTDWPFFGQRHAFYNQVTFIEGQYGLDAKNLDFSEQEKAALALKYQGHFDQDEALTAKSHLPLRHVQPFLRQWLINFYERCIKPIKAHPGLLEKLKMNFQRLGVPEELLSLLFYYGIDEDYKHRGIAVLTLISQKNLNNVFEFRQHLSVLLAKQPPVILEILDISSAKPDPQAAGRLLIATISPGSINEGTMENNRARFANLEGLSTHDRLGVQNAVEAVALLGDKTMQSIKRHGVDLEITNLPKDAVNKGVMKGNLASFIDLNFNEPSSPFLFSGQAREPHKDKLKNENDFKM